MENNGSGAGEDFVQRLAADYRLARFARSLLETRSIAAAVGREE